MGMEHAWLLPAIPAAVFVVVALFHRMIPRQGDFLAILGMAAVTVLSLLTIVDFQDGGDNVFTREWLNIGGDAGSVLLIEISTYYDSITAVMVAVVSIVTLMVMVYSVGYMRGEARYGWYFAALSLFAAAMLALVLADNLLLLYIAWEGVGVCSFLLIGFYHEKQSAVEAAQRPNCS